MNTQLKSARGFTLADSIVAIVLIGLCSAGFVLLAGTYGKHMAALNSTVQENSYQVLQNEIALSGASPVGMAGSNPLSAVAQANSPIPASTLVASAGRSQTGSANVAAYTASQDVANRSAALGYRIASTGTAVPAPPAPALAPPTFLYSGVVPEADFNPNLTGLIIPNSGNPAGTVYRYTTDGTTPTASSPIWTAASYLPAYPLPSTVKAAAFNSDPDWSQSAVVTTALSRSLTINYSRTLGGTSTGFLYSDVTGGTNDIVLSITNMPPGTTIFYTFDGSVPTAASNQYVAPFQVPIGSWSAAVTLNVIAISPATNITVNSATYTLTPIAVQMPMPTFGATGGTTTAATVPVFSTVSGAVLRYDIDESITPTSPTTTSGNSVTVTAPQ